MTLNPLSPILAASALPRLERITDYLAHWATHASGREAASEGHRCITYADLSRDADRLAQALLARGLQRGDLIATLAAPGIDFWTLFLAAASLGITWVGLNPRYTREELAHVLRDARPRLITAQPVIGQRDYREDLDCLTGGSDGWVALDTLLAEAERTEPLPALEAARSVVTPHDVVLLVYTSGSTGRPKGARLHQGGIARAAWAHASVWYIDPFRSLNNLPINHVGCVCDLACTTLVAGGLSAFMPQFDAEGSLAEIEARKLTLWAQIPTQFQLSLQVPGFAAYDLSSLQLIVWSGAPASADLVGQLHAICPNLATSYGMTETIGSVTMTPQTSDPGAFEGTIGWPDPGREVTLSEGQSGEILVRDEFVMQGYLNRSPADPESWDASGRFRTGDLAERRPDGAFRLTGRAKEMFKSGGYNVYPREVEQVLERHPAIASAIVVPVPDPLYGEVGHAFVTAAPDSDVDRDAILKDARASLANYKLPKHITVIEQMPLLAIGKIDRVKLARQARGES